MGTELSAERIVTDPAALFGSIDIYVFDQLLRGRIAPGMRIFDAGCGRGRNLQYFLRAGYDVSGIDADPLAVEAVAALAAECNAQSSGPFRVEALERVSSPEHAADVVLCNAVLHFARDDAHFDAMLRGAWSVLSPGGLFFARLASSIGLEDRVAPLGHGRFKLPDGSERYLVDEARLESCARELGAERIDPIKTTVVQNLRSMTTWVLRKRAEPRSHS